MVRLITHYRILKVLVGMLAVSQLIACVDEGNNASTTSGSMPVGGGTTQSSSLSTTQSSSLSLSWVAPATRADGNPISLADIDGYKVYFGTSTGNYTGSVDITDGSQNSVTVTGLSGGTYHVAMTTYDNNGLESIYSPEIIKTAQ